MPSKRITKPRALGFEHPLKAPLERWLLLSNRLAEVGESLVQLDELFSGAKKHRKDIDMPSEAVRQIRPLYCFAVVTYVRCFGGGRRQPLQISDVPQLTVRDLQTHEDVRTLRNHHFAHAVLDEEGAHIIAIPPQAGLKGGFVVHDIVLASAGAKDIRAFLKLVRKVRRFVKSKGAQAGDDLARAIFGPGATWATCLENGVAIKGRHAYCHGTERGV